MSFWQPGDNRISDLAHDSPSRLLWPIAIFVGLGFWLPPGPGLCAAGAALVLGGALVGLLIGGPLGLLFVLGCSVAFETAYHGTSEYAPLALPMELLRQTVRLLAAPLLVHLCLPATTSVQQRITLRHIYLPLLVALPLTLLVTSGVGFQASNELALGIDVATMIFGLYYFVLFVLVMRERSHKPAPRKSDAERAAEAERSGRFAVAGRIHARAGRLTEAAEVAERGGDLQLAARLYRDTGDVSKAADIFYRAGRLEEAAEQYLRAGEHAAAARVFEQLGRAKEAATAWERSGDLAAAVRAMEAAGGRPPAEMLYRAGRVAEAVSAWEAEGSHARAAEVLEHEVGDLPGAARCLLRAGESRHAGELLERLGRTDDAIDAFAAAPEGWVDALRLCLAAGRLERAEAIVAALPPRAVDELADERGLLLLARLHQHAGRIKAAISLLQRARRLESSSGATRLLLGRLLLDQGLGELAEQELRAAAEMPLDPAEQMESAYLLGCVLEAQGRRDEACEIFGELAQKDLTYRDVEERYRRLRAGAAS